MKISKRAQQNEVIISMNYNTGDFHRSRSARFDFHCCKFHSLFFFIVFCNLRFLNCVCSWVCAQLSVLCAMKHFVFRMEWITWINCLLRERTASRLRSIYIQWGRHFTATQKNATMKKVTAANFKDTVHNNTVPLTISFLLLASLNHSDKAHSLTRN